MGGLLDESGKLSFSVGISYAFVGRAHEPADAPIGLRTAFFAKNRRFTPSQPGQNRHLIGGVMTPPYEMVLI